MTRSSLLVVASALVALAACSDQGFNNLGNGDDGFGPDIQVSPGLLEYSTLGDGETEVKVFTVTNIGTSDLEVSTIEISGSASFTVLNENLAFTLPPEASLDIEVLFAPMGANEQFGTALVHSNDPDNEVEQVDLVGYGAVPEIQINPDPYDFGLDYIGCLSGHEFTVSNVGTDELVVTDLSFQTPDRQMSMEGSVVLPVTLAPGESFPVYVEYEPSLVGETQGRIVTQSNDPRGEVAADITGEADHEAWIRDVWDVPSNPAVDIMFLFDDSCSMDDDRASLASNASTFITGIGAVTSGWQIGVAKQDSGCFNQGIITASTANYQSVFSQAVSTVNGGRFTESLWTVAEKALQASRGGCNSGFLRAGSVLHLIAVSDEPEQSSQNWSYFVTAFQSYVDDPSLLKMSAVAGDYPGGCGSAQAGTGYYEAVNATGGEYLSICSNWGSNVEALAAASVEGLFDFHLSDTPDESTIEVYVDGAQWMTDWHWDSSTNTIVFDAEVPEGAHVEVNYGVVTTCD